MRRKSWLLSLSAMFFVSFLASCGSGNKQGGGQTTLANANRLGDLNCLQCHNSGKDLTMVADARTIGAVWADSLHMVTQNSIVTVHCEDCHGGGQFHWGTGPLPYPVPMARRCLQCHSGARATNLGLNDKSSYLNTDHANRNNTPNSTYSQIATPVSTGRHIEECSVCHNSNQKFVYDNVGNLLKPDPSHLPTPQVACASCHDAHQVARTDPNFANGDYQIFRKVQVNANGANDAVSGTWQRPRLYRDDLDTPATLSYPLDANGKRELNIETSCSSCHTVGVYKNSGTATHQVNVGSQWKNSAHATRTEAAWAEFSANPTAYNAAFASGTGTHQSIYPFDMSLGPNKVGATLIPGTQNKAVSNGRGGFNDNYPCYKCHNGMGSIDWQKNVQGTAAASVIWGDEPATCLTCHTPHPRTDLGSSVNDMNIRKPVVMTNYATTSATIVGNVFLDGTAVSAQALGATSVICIFCHQGRESGLTLYKTKLAAGKVITGNFFNPHYLGTAAMLWGANGYEYAGKNYGVNSTHQMANCATCHMANPTANNLAGGHTWERNVATCNVSACHARFGPIPAIAGTVTPDLSNYRATFDKTNYSGDANGTTQGIADAIRSLQQKLIALLAAQPRPIYYNDSLYPYFFSTPTFTDTGFTAWTPATYKAAFNLSFVVKGLASAAIPQNNVPNGSAAAHDHIYCIQLLQDSYQNLNGGTPLAGATRPVGIRPATVYGPGQ